MLERVLDLGQSITHGETQVALKSIELYAAGVIIRITLSCRDERLDALSERVGRGRAHFRLPIVIMDDVGTTYGSTLPNPARKCAHGSAHANDAHIAVSL